MEHNTEKPKRGRPLKGLKPMSTLQRVRKHRYRQELKNEQHMKELIEIIKICNEKKL